MRYYLGETEERDETFGQKLGIIAVISVFLQGVGHHNFPPSPSFVHSARLAFLWPRNLNSCQNTRFPSKTHLVLEVVQVRPVLLQQLEYEVGLAGLGGLQQAPVVLDWLLLLLLLLLLLHGRHLYVNGVHVANLKKTKKIWVLKCLGRDLRAWAPGLFFKGKIISIVKLRMGGGGMQARLS